MTVCAVCGAAGAKKCSRCKSTFYCSVEHQKTHWKEHKKLCAQRRQPSPLQQRLEADAKRFGLRPVLKVGSLLECFSDCLGDVLSEETKQVLVKNVDKDLDDIYSQILDQERNFFEMFEISFFSTKLPRSIVAAVVETRIMEIDKSETLKKWIDSLKNDKDNRNKTMLWLLWRYLYQVCNVALQNFPEFKLVIRCEDDSKESNFSMLHYSWVQGSPRASIDPEIVGFTASSTIGWLTCKGDHPYPCNADDCSLPVLEKALLQKIRNTPLWYLEPSKNDRFDAANFANGKLVDVIWVNGVDLQQPRKQQS
mmetsp:Transcript_37145/g.72954  ORF Transcript_37145/g.72954 Transcript_37145/m.72954 type:complete len:309 (-) Transcript_37145:206-1132(-)|eukprot:CAMPEP_0175123880 /NCGR_PEP_ID=MMETSP0087-20121206/2480_1 /TAXON_ID=136419 /ORGANISM="Unknown Unknown, Strain D1" /LENGTH=308 /DNA_ID=CAMNT_0016405603 /DNA_START=13 /DNA_END=939 /DNA_ORIENTATION=-